MQKTLMETVSKAGYIEPRNAILNLEIFQQF
jgi:hypothetical protein